MTNEVGWRLVDRLNLATGQIETLSDQWASDCGWRFHGHTPGDVTCFCGRYPTAIGRRHGLIEQPERGPQLQFQTPGLVIHGPATTLSLS